MRNVFIFKTSFLQLIYESFYGQKWWKWKPSSSDVTGGCSFLRELQNLKKVFSRVGADFCRYLGKYCFVFVPVKRRVLLETRATTYVERKIHWTTPLSLNNIFFLTIPSLVSVWSALRKQYVHAGSWKSAAVSFASARWIVKIHTSNWTYGCRKLFILLSLTRLKPIYAFILLYRIVEFCRFSLVLRFMPNWLWCICIQGPYESRLVCDKHFWQGS